MTNTGESIIDHELLANAARDIRSGADELNIDKEVADIMAAFREETSEGAGTGVPIIWKSTELWLEECLGILRSRLEDVKRAMYADAQALEDFSATVRAHQAEVAGEVRGLEAIIAQQQVSQARERARGFDTISMSEQVPIKTERPAR